MMGDGDGDNISMIGEANSQMSVNTAAAATRLPTVQDFLYELGIKNKKFHVDKVQLVRIALISCHFTKLLTVTLASFIVEHP